VKPSVNYPNHIALPRGCLDAAQDLLRDYATNELGTCKHIEFVLARLEKKHGAKTAFARGWRPVFSEIYLRNEGARGVYFRAGSDCTPAVMETASRLFDASRGGVLPAEHLGELERFLATAAQCGHELRPYDDALDFVAGRTLIGDEMGLGKTIQAIAATEILARHFGVAR